MGRWFHRLRFALRAISAAPRLPLLRSVKYHTPLVVLTAMPSPGGQVRPSGAVLTSVRTLHKQKRLSQKESLYFGTVRNQPQHHPASDRTMDSVSSPNELTKGCAYTTRCAPAYIISQCGRKVKPFFLLLAKKLRAVFRRSTISRDIALTKFKFCLDRNLLPSPLVVFPSVQSKF